MFAGWAGVAWYGAQIALAGRIRHPQARVIMEELRRGLDVHYHGLGGAPRRTAKVEKRQACSRQHSRKRTRAFVANVTKSKL